MYAKSVNQYYFILIICKLSNRVGWYFAEHYMNEHLCISKIYVKAEVII